MAEHVLITVGNGMIEAYAEPGVRVKIVKQIDAQTAKGERISEAILERQLPRVYRRLFLPGNRVACESTAALTPSKAQEGWEVEQAIRRLNRLVLEP